MKKIREIIKAHGQKILTILVMISFIIPMIYSIFKIIISPYVVIQNEVGTNVKTDYFLMLFQSITGILLIVLPSKILKKEKFEIPSTLYIFYILFLYASMFLGEFRNYYYKVPHWDTILHTFSGGMLGVIGFSFINLLNKERHIHVRLTPIFVALFAFCFAVALGTIWEIFEYVVDGILGLNMQKFKLENGMALLGRMALADTMEDIIVDCIGAFTMAVIGYISLKYKKGWIEKMLIKTR